MGHYHLTTRGKVVLVLLFLIAGIVTLKGSIYLAVFGFVFFTTALVITLYETFINR